MATASPIPYAVFPSSNTRAPHASLHTRSTSSRAAGIIRPQSPFRSFTNSQGFSANVAPLQDFSIGDSSEDEGPPPMVAFSAQTRAILEDQQVAGGVAAGESYQNGHLPPNPYIAHTMREENAVDTTPSKERLKISRSTPPSTRHDARGVRIIRLSPKRASLDLLRDEQARLQDQTHELRGPLQDTSHEYITPASSARFGKKSYIKQIESISSSATGSGKSEFSGSHPPESQERESPEQNAHRNENDLKLNNGPESTQRNRSKAAGDAMPNSMRVKRVPATGSFLRGAPMRRGARRRQSDEDHSPITGARAPIREAHLHGYGDEGLQRQEHNVDVVWRDFAATSGPASPSFPTKPRLNEGSAEKSIAGPYVLQDRPIRDRSLEREDAHTNQDGQLPREQSQGPQAGQIPSQPVNGFYDQENIPPPTFKRNQITTGMLGDRMESLGHGKPTPEFGGSPKFTDRPILASLSKNIPAVLAPAPPPMMSVLEVATTNAGASTVKSKKKRSHITVNGKVFTLRGRLGKGGSSDVWRVMAENDKIFALKKVNLEDCNEETVRGFKGEIDLLKTLVDDDRVVRLFDWEVNEHKQTLSVLMEIGESDLNRILGSRIHPEGARLDLSFTRFYWREMLECVAAVHAHDIVHSDLKPANFLLVQGRLKLIDFGIANAIDTDNTVNVHRDTNVGTPNYMSPESLQDSKDGKRPPGGPKLMKLGKPSDVWSLGCILYQMTYGKPPFAHIPNQWNRVMAIVNPEVEINFPNVGVGGLQVPQSLRSLLRRCLDRDFKLRPTIAQLLDRHEPFLNPDAVQDGRVPMTEDMLAQILRNVVNRCKDPRRGIPTEAELRAYPKGFLDRIRASLEKT